MLDVNAQEAVMAETYSSYSDFITGMVLPYRRAHPEWRRLNGRREGGDRTRVAYFNHENRLFCVHGDAEIESLLAPFSAMQRGISGPILVIGPTKTGKREKLKPGPGAGSEKGFYVYQHP